MTKITAEYTLTSEWDLDEICNDHNINKSDIIRYFIKYDTLYVIFTNAAGDRQEIEVEADWPASEFDFKHPTNKVR
jgi:hypothetical protein